MFQVRAHSFPFNLKVEIEEAPVVTDLKDCQLIYRDIVVDLNERIEQIGAEKVTVLREIKDSRKGINLLEWYWLSKCSL